MSTTNQNNDSTSVEEVEINLDEILGTPGAENVMLPDGDGKKTDAKPSIFSSTKPDLSFIDNGSDDDDDEPLSDEQIEALKRAMAANNESASPAAVNLVRRALTAIGVSLLLWVIFGDGKGFWIVIAIAALLIGSRLRKA